VAAGDAALGRLVNAIEHVRASIIIIIITSSSPSLPAPAHNQRGARHHMRNIPLRMRPRPLHQHHFGALTPHLPPTSPLQQVQRITSALPPPLQSKFWDAVSFSRAHCLPLLNVTPRCYPHLHIATGFAFHQMKLMQVRPRDAACAVQCEKDGIGRGNGGGGWEVLQVSVRV